MDGVEGEGYCRETVRRYPRSRESMTSGQSGPTGVPARRWPEGSIDCPLVKPNWKRQTGTTEWWEVSLVDRCWPWMYCSTTLYHRYSCISSWSTFTNTECAPVTMKTQTRTWQLMSSDQWAVSLTMMDKLPGHQTAVILLCQRVCPACHSSNGPDQL